MADETIGVTHGARRIIQKGSELLTSSHFDVLTLSVGGNTAQAGHIVTINGETYPACDLGVTSDLVPYAVILGPVFPENVTDYDIDTAITDGELVHVLKVPVPRGVTFLAFLKAVAGPIALVPPFIVGMSSEAGKVMKFVYGDAAAGTDTLESAVGRIATLTAGSAADDLIIEVGGL